MNGITDAQRLALAQIQPGLDAGTYLAGGVAAALSLHHRRSMDLDLFVPLDFDPERLAERIAAVAPEARVVGRARGTLHLDVNSVPTSILSYRYPSLVPAAPHPDLAFPVVSLDDLVCMKLSAIAGRGAAKDFWDLDALIARGAAEGSLAHALDLFTRKYASEDVGHVLRSLAYFGEADAAPLPLGLTPGTWTELKTRIRARIQTLPA
jgi:hypothetical protein